MEPASPQPAPVAASAAAPETPRLSKREGRSPRDMFLSLAVLLVPIALLLTFYRVMLNGDAPITVDPSSAIQQASKEFTVAQPAGLSDDWHVSSATFRRENDGATLRIGYVTPDDDAVQLLESTVAPETIVPAELGKDGKRIGAYRTDQRAWYQYSGREGEIALVTTERTRTIIILGGAGRQESLEQLASALP